MDAPAFDSIDMSWMTGTGQAPSDAHGRTHPLRWDASTAAAVIVLAALGLLGLIAVTFTTSVRVGR
jgi:hypothetical protein